MKGPVHEWVCRDRVRGPLPLSLNGCNAPASKSGEKYEGGQQQYDETRGFARQAREKVGWSLDTFVLRIC